MVATVTDEKPRLISPQEAAKEFGKSLAAIRYWYRTGTIQRYYRELDKRVFVDGNEIARKLAILPTDTGEEG